MRKLSAFLLHAFIALAFLAGPSPGAAQSPATRVAPLAEARIKAANEADPLIREAEEAGQTQSLAPIPAAAAAGNYVFATSTTASLVDMSSGTTTLVAADQDDTASAVTLLGFDFYFQGVRQDRFSVNSNGSLRFGATAISNTAYDPLGQATQSLITAYGADQRTHTGNGKVHFKVLGAAPNRELSIEWLNMQADFNAGGTADLTYQVHLFETTGAIEFVYGSMAMSAAGAADANSQSPQFGFSSSNTVGTVGSLTVAQSGTPAPTFSGAAATPVNNLYVAGAIPALTSATNGTRRSFTLTPPLVNAPGGPLTFTAVSATSMTLNWTDSANETGYAIYQSTDGINYTFITALAQDSTSFVANGLLGATTYFWQVYAFSEGDVASIGASQPTGTPVPNSSVGTGLWSSPGTWSTGSVPTSNDAVTISAGTTVTIDTAALSYSTTVAGGAVLQFEQTTARTLASATDVAVQNGGTLQSNPAGTQTGHVLSVAGNLTNSGTLDFSTNADTAGAGITFTGSGNANFGGAGATTDVRTMTINKGVNNTSVLELNPTAFTVRGVTTDTVVGGWLVLTNGTLKLSGTFTGSSRVFSAAAYTIGATTGFWLNNPNYVVAAQAGSPTLAGLLHVSQGTFNIGTSTGNSMGFSTNSTIIIDGGSVNSASRFGVAAAGNAISYTQSAGTITVCTIANTSATLGSFDLGTSVNSSITISGGTIVVQINATAIDYRNQAGSGITGLTGGTLQIGNAASGAAKTFNLRGVLPNVVVTNTSAGHTATMSTTLVNFNNIGLNITVSAGATFNTGNVLFLMAGATFTNNGTLTATGASSNFIWFDAGSGASQTYAGSGVTTAPVTNMSVQTGPTLTFTSTNQFITNRVNLFVGGLVNSNLITLGNGGATTGVVQIGNTTTLTAAGTFDLPPVFNLGTGGQIISYLRTGGSRSTGPEVNPGRALTNFTYDDNDPAHTLTIAGGNLAVATTATLTTGRVITGANVLAIGPAGTVTRTNGYVDGNLRKTFAAAANKTFEVGTANGFSPVAFNATAGTFPADVTVAAVQTPAPGIQPLSDVITRYWNVTATGVTADMTFAYLDPTDIPGTVTEANMHVLHQGAANANDYSDAGGTINAAANTATVTGVSSFSAWTLGTAAADLGVTIDDGVTSAVAGGNVTYTIIATNGGAVGNPAALVNDSFPPSLTCSTTCSGANGGTCTAGPFVGDINDSASIPSGGSVTYTASCAVSPTATGSLSNSVTVSMNAVTDNNLANNSATDTDGLGGVADLAITKTDGVTSATPGGSVTYTITASNAGPSSATGSTVADTFPASLTCTWTCTGTGGGTCTAAGSGNINDAVNLPSGGSTTYTASCSISAAATGTLTNTATVAAPAGVTDPTPGNNSATDSDTLASSADLAITKTDGVTTATPGGSVTYTITSSNAGPSNAAGTTVADTFPASLTCTWTCVGAGGGTCTASGSGNINSIVNLPAGGSVTHTASCTISAGATGTLSNTATVTPSGSVTDPTPGNNSATDSDTLSPQADLAITKTDGVTSVAPGGSVTYTITATNAGPSNATGATVADTFPASETCTWTCSGAGGGTCTASGSGNINGLVNLPSGGSATYTASCTVSGAATGTVSNTATVTAPGGVTDPTPGNNSATDTDTIALAADLSITATDGVTTATPGLGVTYTIVASNAGPSNATGATVADTFPASETCTWTCTAAGGASCAASGSGNIGQSVNLPSGGSVTFVAACSIAASATGSLSNTATVTAPVSINDATPGNNSATDTDTLVPSAVLTVTASDGHTYARYGQTLNYLLKVSNAGPSYASDIGVSETLSADFAAAGAHWTCIGGGAGASCTASGTGPLIDSNAVIPPSRSLTWLVSVSTLVNPANGFADNLFQVTTAADGASPFLRLDTDFFVIFRDGFESGFGDGTGDIVSPIIGGQAPVLTQVASPLAAGQSLAFALPAQAGTLAVDTLASAHAIDGTGFRVERLNLGATPQLRVVAIDVLGAERTSAWVSAAASEHVVLGLVDDGGTAALLETTGGEATLRLSVATEEVYQVRAGGSGAEIVH